MNPITPKEFAKGMMDDLIEVVKEDIPDREEQAERFSPEQWEAIVYCFNRLSGQMFYSQITT